MVKHNRRKGFQAIPFTDQLPLITLGNDLVLAQAPIAAFAGKSFFGISVDTLWGIRGLTAGEGPITVGWAHGDLSTTEIAEALVAEVNDPSDIIARERARRPVRRAGIFSAITVDQTLNDGTLIRTPLRFSISIGKTLVFWAMNQSGAALTTGAILEVQGVVYGRWGR